MSIRTNTNSVTEQRQTNQQIDRRLDTMRDVAAMTTGTTEFTDLDFTAAISNPPTQAEVEALRDECASMQAVCEKLRVDVAAIRAAIKG